MPMYDFLCTACGEKFEELVLNGEAASPACPQCGSTATERQMSAPSPLKTGAFPFKPGPVRPMGTGMPSCGGSAGAGGCGGGGFS
ncbi:zinc ribbon domain-containing protein [Desulfovibrio sp. PG-178-WT-4]|uniref:Zinc ribbon domain-containing protein n=1 Tax=Desulfovibrio porci TaxID=2605782 RepID=A0A6L5XHI2_9BACT|nr:zinc ribbon domain-containing protein [Desulfovibrio porci]MSS26663.1 zinc ribbon domain-containing protein [Desulfovibrio porci]